jgi:hypothetical protein
VWETEVDGTPGEEMRWMKWKRKGIDEEIGEWEGVKGRRRRTMTRITRKNSWILGGRQNYVRCRWQCPWPI